jgi:ferrochelatase
MSKQIGILVAQLGTPDAPTPAGLRAYLREFLSDRRVIDYPPLLWQPILHGMILRTRPRRSARLYQRIWTPEGSPLMLYSRQQVEGLQERLGDPFRVILGMTYGNPSIQDAIRAFAAEGIDRIVVLPMFPQYSSTTSASIYDAVYAAASRGRAVPALRFVAPYYDHLRYIDAMRDHLTAEIDAMPTPPDKFIITFHGIPRRYVETGDPYRAQCEHTARLLAAAMGWRADDWLISFQSRFGPEDWLEPYTDETLKRLHEQGVQRPLVFSPGFVTDCLETLDELGNEGREEFAAGGGSAENFRLAPCLNACPAWLDAMAALILENAGGWIEDAAERAAFAEASR